MITRIAVWSFERVRGRVEDEGHVIAKHAVGAVLGEAPCGAPRWGKVTGLRVKHVNALRRRLNITENAVAYGALVHVGTPKTHEARSVPYLPEPVAVLCEGKAPDDLLLGDGLVHMRRPPTSKNTTSWTLTLFRMLLMRLS
jgi:hypothetical protein